MDLFGSTGESDGDRETVIDGEATARVSLVALVLMLESGVLEGWSRAARERSERRGAIAGCWSSRWDVCMGEVNDKRAAVNKENNEFRWPRKQ